jgi:hypothetical protein
MSKSSVPCGRSIRCASGNVLPFRFYKENTRSLVEVQGELGACVATVQYSRVRASFSAARNRIALSPIESAIRRTNEIGIRMALGADRMNVLQLVLRGAFLQVGIGLAIGIPVAILGGHAMASQLFGVQPYDPLVLSFTLLVLCLAAFLAALLPARIAAGLEPMRALRTE